MYIISFGETHHGMVMVIKGPDMRYLATCLIFIFYTQHRSDI